MKTNISNLRLDSYLSKPVLSKSRKPDLDDDDEFDEDEPWICCRCGTGNTDGSSFCIECGHDKCSHCPEY